MLQNFFIWIVAVPTWEWQKLSPQTEFGLLSCTTAWPTSMGSGMFIWRLDINSFTFYANVSFTTSDIFFNNILSVPWWERWKLSPWTDFGLPPPSQHQWAAACLFWGLYLNSFTFLLKFLLLHLIFFQWHTFCAMMGKVKTQPTNWAWPPTPPHHLANTNGQWWVYF